MPRALPPARAPLTAKMAAKIRTTTTIAPTAYEVSVPEFDTVVWLLDSRFVIAVVGVVTVTNPVISVMTPVGPAVSLQLPVTIPCMSLVLFWTTVFDYQSVTITRRVHARAQA